MNKRKVGYDWESELVKMFSLGDWRALRLGSPSVHLPDVVAVNNRRLTIIAIEAKSSSMGVVKVRADQLKRLFDFLNTFSAYKTKIPVLAIRFMRGGGRKREVRFYIVKGLGPRWVTIRRDKEPNDELISTSVEYLLKAGAES